MILRLVPPGPRRESGIGDVAQLPALPGTEDSREIDADERKIAEPGGKAFQLASWKRTNVQATYGLRHGSQTRGQECPAAIRQVSCRYQDICMDKLPPGLSPELVINQTITLLPGRLPSKGSVYRLGPEELEAQREILQQLNATKMTTITSSPFATPCKIMRKKNDGTCKQQYCMVINYQELNAITISSEHPLPTIQAILDMLHGAKVFTTIDMEQKVQQIRVGPHYQYKTAFRTCKGQYELQVMPFGLRGAPGTFQAKMDHVLFPVIGRGVIAYLDDLLVYSSDVESHARVLERVLKSFKDNKMYLKISKCNSDWM